MKPIVTLIPDASGPFQHAAPAPTQAAQDMANYTSVFLGGFQGRIKAGAILEDAAEGAMEDVRKTLPYGLAPMQEVEAMLNAVHSVAVTNPVLGHHLQRWYQNGLPQIDSTTPVWGSGTPCFIIVG